MNQKEKQQQMRIQVAIDRSAVQKPARNFMLLRQAIGNSFAIIASPVALHAIHKQSTNLPALT